LFLNILYGVFISVSNKVQIIFQASNVETNGVIAITIDTIIPSTRRKPHVVYYL